MNTTQRTEIRLALIAQNFTRTGYTPDLDGRGEYTETWTHLDGTTLTLDWAPKSQPNDPPEPPVDEDDEGGYVFAAPGSEDEGRITQAI